MSAAFFGNMVRGNLLNGSNNNMVVDGSGSDVVFKYDADSTDTIEVHTIQLLVTTDTLTFDGSKFVSHTGLSTGCLLEVVSDGTTHELVNLKMSEDFFQLPNNGPNIAINTSGVTDLMVIEYPLHRFPLIGGSSDLVRMTIRDELDGSTKHIEHMFCATIFGDKI